MEVKELVDILGLEVVNDGDLQRSVEGGYVGDLLSNVMARAKQNNLWITIQGHQNVIAVALLTDVAAVIIAEDFTIEDAAVERAREKGINLLRTPLNAYQLISKMVKMGI